MPKATPRDRNGRLGALLAIAVAGCSPARPAGADAGPADGGAIDAEPPAPDAAVDDGTCPAGGAGLACLFALADEVRAGCAPQRLADLETSLARRHGELPAWHEGRALFVSRGQPVVIAGGWNDWSTTALATAPLCGSDLHVAEAAVPSGRHAYKLVVGGAWQLDAGNWAFAYDGFAGNPDGANSVLNTYDSGVGHLVRPEVEVCSTELGNCRRFYTYLPAGYGAPENADRRYPALFMHDGQNIFDDPDCCFGHTGWEINVRLDAEIAAGTVDPAVVVGFPHGGAARTDEYGYSVTVGGARETFMEFQVGTVQPRAAELWRLDADRYYVAGSSLGGLLSFHLAFAYPDTYAGAASLSGSFWVGEDDGSAMRDVIADRGYVPVPLYMDHGGTAAGGDNYASNVELLGLLATAGWTRADAPGCAMAADVVCYLHDVGATHDELAWRDRSQHFVRYLLGR